MGTIAGPVFQARQPPSGCPSHMSTRFLWADILLGNKPNGSVIFESTTFLAILKGSQEENHQFGGRTGKEDTCIFFPRPEAIIGVPFVCILCPLHFYFGGECNQEGC